MVVIGLYMADNRDSKFGCNTGYYSSILLYDASIVSHLRMLSVMSDVTVKISPVFLGFHVLI